MADSCIQCGAVLTEQQAFCTKCGARRSQTSAPARRFCAKCGKELNPTVRFCEVCGTSAASPSTSTPGSFNAGEQLRQADSPPAAPPFQPVPVPSAASCAAPSAGPSPASSATAMAPGLGQPPIKKSPVVKILVGVLVFLFLIAAGVIGTGVYIGYRIKKKAEQVAQSYKKAIAETASETGSQGKSESSPDLGKLLGELSKASEGQSGSAPDLGKMLQALEQGQSGGSPDLAKILGALSHRLQDKTPGNVEKRPAGTCPTAVQAEFAAYTRSAASASIPLDEGLTLTDVWTPRADQPDIEVLTTVNAITGNSIQVTGKRLVGNDVSSTRNLCAVDLLNGREYETGFGTATPSTIPGATMFTMSRDVFSDLKAGRPAPLTFYEAYKSAGGGYDLYSFGKGTLSRVETNDVPYSIIVNGERKDLPTLHVKGALGTRTFELWVLDDIANPLVLDLKVLNSPFHITYVKITFPQKKEVEQQLAQAGRADIYGIYFDFDKATPRPESAPVMKEIAQALKDNPNWKLEIEGHTDNVGGSSYNLNLSDERAQGIMQSLITQYGIPADRLTAKGFGQTQPKATNDTVEGRALNRRVELVRN